MTQRIEELTATLRSDLHQSAAMDELRAICAGAGQWEKLYDICGELAESVGSDEDGFRAWQYFLQAILAHRAVTADPVMGAELHLRAGDILAHHLGDPPAALAHYRFATEAYPDPDYLDELIERFLDSGQADVVEMLQEQRGVLLGAFAAAPVEPAPVSADEEAALAAPVAAAPVRGAPEGGVEALRAAFAAGAADPGAARALADALAAAGAHAELAEHYAAWMVEARDPSLRVTIAREAAELWRGPLGNTERALSYLRTAFELQPEDVAARDELVAFHREQGNWREVEQVYEVARKGTRDRDEERRLLLERARVLWRELGDMAAAEPLYRRLRTFQPAAEEALDFYEQYYVAEQDWRRLYTTLNQRQSAAKGEDRVAIGVRMARLADEQMDSPDKAVEAWKRVLSAEPEHAEALAELPAIYERTARWPALLEFLNGRVGRLADDQVEEKVALLRQVVALYASPDRLNGPEMVLHTCNRILQIAPNDAEALAILRKRYESAARWSELVGVLRLEVDATDDEAEKLALLKRVAELWRDQLRNAGRAVEPLEMALSLAPGDREVIAALRDIYRSRRNVEDLYEVNRRALVGADEDERVELLRELASLGAERLHWDEEATQDWEAVLALRPGDEEAITELQKLYSKSGAWDRYVELIEGQLAELPDGSPRQELLSRLGKIVFDKLNDYDRARDIFTELGEAQPSHPVARTYLQKIHIMRQSWGDLEALYRESGDWRSYIAVLSDHQEREIDPDLKVELNLQIAHLYEAHLDDPIRALKRYERARRLAPGNLEVARSLATRYRERKDRDKLAEVLETLAEHSQDEEELAGARAELVELAVERGDAGAAFRWSAAALPGELRAGRFEALAAIETRAEAAGLFPALAEVLEQIVAETFDEVALHVALRTLGAVYRERLHEPAKAVDVYQRAMEIDPTDRVLLDALEELYLSMGDVDGLERVLAQRVDAAQDDEEFRENTLKLGHLYEDNIGDPDQAIACYQRLLDRDERDAEARSGLKRIYEMEERWSDLTAILEEESALSDDPQRCAELRGRMGAIHRHQGQVEEAVAAYAAALDFAADHPATIAVLEELFTQDEYQALVAPLLEPSYRAAERWQDLVTVLDVRVEATELPEARAAILRDVAAVREKRLHDLDGAFRARRTMFREHPSNRDVWIELERLAEAVGGWDDVAGLYAAAVGFAPGQAGGVELVATLDEPTDERELTLRLAGVYEKSLGDRALARGCYEKLLDDEPEDAEALGALERLHTEDESWDELLAILTRKAEIAWDSDERKAVYLRMCEILRRHLDREEDAIEVYRRVLEIDESSLAVMGELEHLYRAHERWEDLAALLRHRMAYAEGPAERAELLLQVGGLLREHLGQSEEAASVFQQVLGYEAQRPRAVAALEAMLLASEDLDHPVFGAKVAEILEPLYRQEGRWDELALLLEVRVSLALDDRERAALHRSLGHVHEDHREDIAAAFPSYRDGFLLAPGDDALFEDLGRAAAALGLWEDYATVLAAGLAEDPSAERPALLRVLAELYDQRLGRPVEAVESYERLLDFEPRDIVALAALDRLHAAAGEPERRAEVLRRLAELTDDEKRQGEIWFAIGEIERALDRVDDAVEAFSIVVDRASDKQGELVIASYGHLELLYEQAERWDALIQTLMERFEYSEDLEEQKTYLYRAAMVYEERQESIADAIELYGRALALDSGDEVALSALERLYEDAGDWERLESLLSGQLDRAEAPEERAELLRRLGYLFEEHKGELRRALEVYRALVALEPDHDAGLAGLGRLVEDPEVGLEASDLLVSVFSREGREAAHARILERRLESFRDQIDLASTLFALAALREGPLGDAKGAFACFSEALRAVPRDAHAWRELVRLAGEQDAWRELFSLFEDILPGVYDARERNELRMAIAALHRVDRGDREAAELVYWEILDDEPEHGGALDALEALFDESGAWERLAEVLRRKADIATELADQIGLRRRLAQVLQASLDEPGRAVDVYEEILAIEPSDEASFSALEALYAGRQDWDALVDLLERETSALEDPAVVGAALRRLAQVHQAEREDHAAAVDALVRLLARDEDDEGAVDMLEAIHAEGYERERIGELLAPIYLRQKAWRPLVSLYESYLEDPALADSERRGRLRSVYQTLRDELEDYPAAFRTLCEMIRLSPEDRALHEQAFELADILEDWAAVATLYRELLDGDLDDTMFVWVALRLAALDEERLALPAAAAAEYRRVLERQEDHEGAIEALERLYRAAEDWRALVALYGHVAAHVFDDDRAVAAHLSAAELLGGPLGEGERAAEELQRAIERQPENRQARELAEAIFVELGADDERESLYRSWLEVLSEPGERAAVQLRLARLLLESRGELLEAMDLFRDIFVAVPLYGEALRYLEQRLDSGELGAAGEDLHREIVEVLEPVYDEQTPAERWIALHLAQLEYADEPERRAEILQRVAEDYLERANDPHRAFEFFGQAFSLDFGDEALEAQLERLAEAHGEWEALLSLYADGLGLNDDDFLLDRYLRRCARIADERIGDRVRAAGFYERILEREPAEVEALRALEQHYRGSGQPERLREILSLLLDTPMSADERVATLLRLGALLRDTLRDTDAAEAVYQDVVLEAPENREALAALEQIAIERGDWAALVDTYESMLRFVDVETDRVDLLSRVAQVYETQLDRVEDAVQCYNDIFALQPDSPYAVASLERIYRDRADWDRLLEILRKKRAASSQPVAQADLDCQIGRLLFDEIGMRGEAIVSFERALSIQPTHEGATSALQELLEDPEYCLEAARILLPVLTARGDWDALVPVMELRAELEDDPVARARLHGAVADLQLDRRGDVEAGFAALGKALALTPDDKKLEKRLLALAKEYEAWTLLADTLEEARLAVGERARAKGICLWLGRLYEEYLKNASAAIDCYQEVLLADEFNHEALHALDGLLRAESRWDDLAEVLARRIQGESAERLPALRYRLARLRESELADRAGALDLYREILWEQPDHEEAITRLEALARDPELQAEIVDVLEPLYRQQERWTRLTALLSQRAERMEAGRERAELLRSLAELYESRLDDVQNAFEMYARALAEDEDAADIVRELDRITESHGMWSRLAVAFEEALARTASEETRRELQMRLGVVYMTQLRNPAKAEAHLRAVLQREPGNLDALRMLEESYETSGKLAELVEVCERRAELPIDLEERKSLYRKIATVSEVRNDTAAAVRANEAVLELDASDVDALAALEDIFEREERYEELVATLQRRVELSEEPGEVASLRVRVGQVYEAQLGELVKAVDSYEDALERDPEHLPALDALERLYGQLGRWSLMRDVLERRARRSRDDEEKVEALLRAAALSEGELGEPAAAVALYERVLEVQPGNPAALDELARIHEEAGAWKELVLALSLRAESCDDGELRVDLRVREAGILERYLGDFDGALARIEEVLAVAPDSVAGLMALGRLRESMEDWPAAVEVYDKLLPGCEGRDRIGVLVRLARLLLEALSEPSRARSLLEEASALDPEDPAVLELRARVLRQEQRWDELALVLERRFAAVTAGEKPALALELSRIHGQMAGDSQARVRWLEEAYRLDPQRREVVEGLIDHYEAEREDERLADLFARLIETLVARHDHRDIPALAFRLGAVRERLGERPGALVAYRLCREHDAANLDNLMALGRLLYEAREGAEAMRVLQAVLLQQNRLDKDQLAEVFLQLTELSLQADDHKRARQYVGRLLRLQPEHPRGLEVKARL